MTLSRRAVLGGAAALAGWTIAPVRAASGPDDAAILRRAYELLHPGLYRYQTEAQVRQRFDAFEAAWRADDDIAKRYLALSRLLGPIQCGHSYANFYNQKDAVVSKLFGGRNKLPFQFRWLGEKMVVTGDPTRALPRGGIVKSIDERPVASILRALLPITRADGGNNAKRRQLLSVQGVDNFESFDCYYPLVFPVGDTVVVKGRAPDGKSFTQSLPTIDLAARRAQRTAKPKNDGPVWQIEHTGRQATLTMDGWALYNSKWDWSAWLTAAFDDMARRGTDKLIIDIRRNEGGLDCGNDIIARLIDAPLSATSYARRVRYRRVPDDLAPYLDTWDPTFKDWGADATPFDARFYSLKGDGDGPRTITPKGPRFKGKVVVLVSAENSSATFNFADLMQRNRLATLVGEPTGGNRRGINGGAFFFLRLPQSGLEADLPLIGYFPQTPQPDAGIMPDVFVPTTAADIASGRDVAMERAVAV